MEYDIEEFQENIEEVKKLLIHAKKLEELVKELQYAKGITFQYFFGTPLALSKLTKS